MSSAATICTDINRLFGNMTSDNAAAALKDMRAIAIHASNYADILETIINEQAYRDEFDEDEDEDEYDWDDDDDFDYEYDEDDFDDYEYDEDDLDYTDEDDWDDEDGWDDEEYDE